MSIARFIVLATLGCALLLFRIAPRSLAADETKPAIVVTQGAAAPSGPAESPATEIKAAATPETAVAVPAGVVTPGQTPAKGETPGQPSAKADDAKTKEPVKSIHRPATPPTPPDREELKVRPGTTGKVRLRFNGQPWQPVLEWLAMISGMSLDWQDLPGDYLNLTTQRSYTVPEVRDLINRHLLARGFTLLSHGEVLTVVEIKKLDPSLVPRVEPGELARRDPHEYVKVTFPLVSLSAETAANELKPMLSPNGRLTAIAETNQLEAMDAVTNLCDLEAVLRQQQLQSNRPRSFREFPLKHARAEEVHSVLASLLGVEPAKNPAMTAQQQGNPAAEQAMMMARAQAAAQGQPQPGGHGPKDSTISLAINVRNNSILAQAPLDKMAVIAQVIEAVDIPVERGGSLLANMNRVQVYRLSGVDPEPVIKTLVDIGNLDPATRLEVDKKNSAIIASGSLADHVTIRALVDKLVGSERKFEVIRLRRLAADYVAGTIDFMLGSGGKKNKRPSNPWMPFEQPQPAASSTREFRVDADTEHNRLLLWANPVELAEVEALLVKLGEIPAAGSQSAGVRVIDGGDEKETQELIERIRHIWPTVAPNALQTPALQPAAEENKQSAPSVPILPQTSPAAEPAKELPPALNRTAIEPPATLLHWAQMRREPADASPSSGTVGSTSANRPRDSALPSPPPVKIAIGPDGKLIVSSDDPQALDRLEELVAQLPSGHKSYRVFHLKYAWAVGVALNLEDFFKEDKKERSRPFPWMMFDPGAQDDSQDERRLSSRRKPKFISDADSNTILVEGADAKQLKTIEDLIQLYDQPPPNDSQSVRKTEIVRLKYSKAKAVADTVKDVYRDLLSANDKALAGSNQGRESGRTFVFNYSDTDKSEQKTPRFKGLLSIGIDEPSNSLVVSAPAYLFDPVTKMIKELDEAAAPDYTVRMVHVRPGITADRVKEILDQVYRQKSAETPANEKRTVEKRAPAKPSKASAPGARGKAQQQGAGGS